LTVARLCSLVVMAACGFHPHGAASSDALAAPDGVVSDGTRASDASGDAAVRAIGHVQNQIAIVAGSSLTATFGAAVSAGDLLVGSFRCACSIAVADNVNGSWTLIDHIANIYMFYVPNTAAAPAGGLTVTMTAAVTDRLRIVVDEFSNVATSSALDQFSDTNAATTSTWTAAPTSAIPAGELVYASGGSALSQISFAPGTTNGVSLTLGGQVTDSNNDGSSFSVYALSAAAGSQDASVSVSPAAVCTGVQATFRGR
jgi:hypothetical protein